MPLKEKVKSKTSTTATNWFHERFGKFSGEEGAAVLELLLLRREVAKTGPDQAHWMGYFWCCPWCQTHRIGRTAMHRGLAVSVHRLFCNGRNQQSEPREARG